MGSTSNPKEGTPSFFKILLDPSAPHLAVPSTFVKRHLKNKIPQHPILRLQTGECSWHMKIKKIKGNYYLAHGWTKVVQDTHLGFGDFLVFCLVDRSTFEVSIYGPSGCQKDPFSISNENCDRSRTRSRNEDLIMGKDMKIEEGEDLKNEYEYENENPCFQKIISLKTHRYIMRLPKKFVAEAGIRSQGSMVVKDLEGREWRMRLQVEILWGSRYYLSTGWPDFRDHNKLSDGDICLFKFIVKEGKLNLTQVIKKKVPPRNRSLKPLIDIKCDTIPLQTRMVKRKRGISVLKATPNGIKSEDEFISMMGATKRKRGRSPVNKSDD